MPAKTYYEVLGVEPTASAKEIRIAYRQLATKYHPDELDSHGMGELGPEFKELANARMKEINAAYDVLKDPQKRAAHDSELAQRRTAEANQQQAQRRSQQAEEAWHRQQEQEEREAAERAAQERRRREEERRRQAQEAQQRREAAARAAREQPRRGEEEQQQREVETIGTLLKEGARMLGARARMLGILLVLPSVAMGMLVLLWHLTYPPTPRFVGSTLAEASEKAARTDFDIEVTFVSDSSEPKGTILSQGPATNDLGLYLPWKKPSVSLSISGGQGKVVVPHG